MDEQISSMDESIIRGCHPQMEVAFMDGGTSSIDESAICGFYPWMENLYPWMTPTDEDDR